MVLQEMAPAAKHQKEACRIAKQSPVSIDGMHAFMAVHAVARETSSLTSGE